MSTEDHALAAQLQLTTSNEDEQTSTSSTGLRTSSSSTSPIQSPHHSGVIIPIRSSIGSKNIYRWMIPTLEYLSLDVKGSTSSNKSKERERERKNIRKLPSTSSTVVSGSGSGSGSGSTSTTSTVVQGSKKNNNIPALATIPASSLETSAVSPSKEDIKWSSNIQTLCITMDQIYNTLENNHSIERCDSVIQTLSNVLKDFQTLRTKITTTPAPPSSTPSSQEKKQQIDKDVTQPTSSSASTVVSSVPSADTAGTSTTSTATGMKWSDRLKIAMENMRSGSGQSQHQEHQGTRSQGQSIPPPGPSSQAQQSNNERSGNNNNSNNNLESTIRHNKEREFESRQQKAKENREAMLTSKKHQSKYLSNQSDRVKEFNKRTEERVAQERAAHVEKQERADQLHDEHISSIQLKGINELKRAEEIKWISDQTSENDRYMQQKRLEKSESRRQKIAMVKKQKESLITKREEAAATRRREIDASRAQILLGSMPIAPPISDDYKRKIRSYCRYCNVPITSEAALQAHLQDLQHQNNLKNANLEKKTSLVTTVGQRDGNSWVVTLPYDSFSTNRLAPLSNEVIEKIKSEEEASRPKLVTTLATLKKLVINDFFSLQAIGGQVSDDYTLKQTFTKTINELNGHIQRKDYAKLQYHLIDITTLLNKYCSQDDYLNFAKLNGLQALSKICFLGNTNSSEHKTHTATPTSITKTTMELISKLCSVDTNVCYLLSLGLGAQFIDLLGRSILSTHDMVIPFLPPLIALINKMFTIANLEGLPLPINEYKSAFINYIVDSCIFEKLELKLPHLQLGMLEGMQGPMSMAEETIQLLVSVTTYFKRFDTRQVTPFLALPESANLVMALKKTNVVGVLSLLTFIMLHNRKKQTVRIEIPPSLSHILLQTLELFVNLSHLDLPFVQSMLGSDDYQVEFYHFVIHLLLYCTQRQETEKQFFAFKQHVIEKIVMLLGYYSLRNERNQEILHWGDKISIIQILCNLPFIYFFEKDYMRILLPTLLVLCNNRRSRDYIKLEMDVNILLRFITDITNDGTVGDYKQLMGESLDDISKRLLD
ncbi:hypothetical protein SAMD00019534_086870 [Acytostelium subglobosum LB1]|uniref:hypothetical protein n=1 Tax=Acytostelium subglobosum LB1 TaxID=1410327 RepID=UPI000644D7B3|nr:hypothetical protein SAMD00019534_086870 [Acytostelium subglobosum LB1]GAM25512.1 hypothetical protein SAMD00019534_086870 [Acytostelium subglobosum LB1]|eukprot:XP_012751498.1 hypothetical protein SAMD00019534_086870 [Acytostelium subglobosum LB1]